MDLSAIIRRAVEIGDQHGFITFDHINELFNELLPSSAHRLEPEAIESLLNALSDRGIDVREA
ncbi:MAG TPA: RNA polymerase sigma factor region1.1 domain-containing protein [Bradyrhizobium sp.]|mgnify:CR=1 FL=1|jgi:Sigma-70 factor, region 1.